MSSTVDPKEIILTCQDGIKLAGQRWTTSEGSPGAGSAQCLRIICLHGWLDNCATFHALSKGIIQELSSSTCHVDIVAIDLPGHGRSSHKSLDGPTMVLADYVYYVYDALQQLEWSSKNNVIAIGHSMGASIALLYAASFPVSKLILLDSLGPRTQPAENVTKEVQKHIKARMKGKPPSSVYPSLEEAVETRCLTATVFPGDQYISKETAKALVERASFIRDDDGQLEFLHDQRLKWPSIINIVDTQLDQIYKDVAKNRTTKTCILIAKDGMPFSIQTINRAKELIRPTIFESLPGSHHFHSDPKSCAKVIETIVNFLMLE